LRSILMPVIKVSIIVPVYNVEPFLKECLNSLVNQKLKEIEIILINDGSTDNSGLICNRYAESDHRIKVVQQTNQGLSLARNTGLLLARGEYILYVDSDDYIAENTLEVLYSTAIKYDLDILNADLLNDSAKLKDPAFRKIEGENKILAPTEFIKQKLESGTYDIVSVQYFVKREYLKTNGMFFEAGRLYEDQLYTLKLLSIESGKIMKIRFPFYYYRYSRQGSITSNIGLKHGLDSAYMINKMFKYIENLTVNPVHKNLYSSILLCSFYQFVCVYIQLNKKDRSKALAAVDRKTISLVLSCKNYYRILYRRSKQFYNHPELYTLVMNVKKLVMRIRNGK